LLHHSEGCGEFVIFCYLLSQNITCTDIGRKELYLKNSIRPWFLKTWYAYHYRTPAITYRYAALIKKNRTINRQHATPTRASKMRHAWKVKRENVGITSLTRGEALAFVNTELSKHRDQLAMMSER
jgi:hypothetical protein